jgi:hypothetical protein
VIESPAFARIADAWRRRTRGVAAVALAAGVLLVGFGAAHVARLGTLATRLGALAALAIVLVLWVGVQMWTYRAWRNPRWMVRRVIRRADRHAAPRALRALSLVERTTREPEAGSPELAGLHLERILARVPTDAVDAAGRRHATRWQVGGLLAVCITAGGVAADPMRALEGLNVMVARDGRAPLPVEYLGYSRVRALPPSYTRQPERAVVLGASVALPTGTAVTFRGVPRLTGRQLVLSDGTDEVPFLDDGAGGLVARMTVRREGRLRVAARFGDVLVEEAESLFVHALPDRPPVIVLEGAPRIVRLSEVEDIDIRWIAEDDYALRQVDLVLRSGAREERRVLSHFEGESSAERGAHVLKGRDTFLRRMFLPIELTVQARDNDPFEGPNWGISDAITLIPPAVGEAEAERYRTLLALRNELVGLHAAAVRPQPGAPPLSEQVAAFSGAARVRLEASYAGLEVPRGLRSFVFGQLRKVEAAARSPKGRTAEVTADAVLALDAALGSLGQRDAQTVAKRLGDVAEEVATGAHLGRETEDRAGGLARAGEALAALKVGAEHLTVLGDLGRDVGSVAMSDSRRIERAREQEDLLHMELAALHLAARLRRPLPSFGAKGGRGGGVEAGAGSSSGSSPSADDVRPSDADRKFDALAEELGKLAREHGDQMAQVEDALQQAASKADLERLQTESQERAQRLRDTVAGLPPPGEPPGTRRAAEALAREHAAAAAHALEKQSLPEALDSAKNALGTLRESRRRAGTSALDDAELDSIERELSAQIEWMREQLERLARGAEARAAERLRDVARREHDMAERAQRLSDRGRAGDATLPEEVTDRLEKAESIMREAARALGEGRGRQALELQREAQRLLERSDTGRTQDADDAERQAPEGQDGPVRGGRQMARGGDVPEQDDQARAEEFRRRVLRGLAEDKSERLSPAVRRYAEGLLR